MAFQNFDLSQYMQRPPTASDIRRQAQAGPSGNQNRSSRNYGFNPGGPGMPAGFNQDQMAQRMAALMGGGSGSSSFPGAPNAGSGGLFPSIGSGPYGIRDQAPGLLGYDLERQQGAYDAAFQGQSQALGQAAQMFAGMGGSLQSIGVSGLEEIRGLNQDALGAFEANKAATLGDAKNRYLGNQASNVAATSGRIASEKNRIMSDPTMSPAQKNAMVQELSFGIGQQGYGAAQGAFSEYQALNTGLQAQFAGQEQQLRGQNTGFIGQAYDRLGQLTATGQQAGAAGLAQVGQLMGAMPQQLVSLFGGLTNLEQFRQGTPWQTTFRGDGPYGLRGTISGMPGQTFNGNQYR
jgi:hypothetical protein